MKESNLSERRHSEPVENYTNAFLVSFGVLVFVLLWIVWALWGLVAMLSGSFSLDRVISFLGRNKRRQGNSS